MSGAISPIEAQRIYEQKFGAVKTTHGFSLTYSKTKTGILIMKWYQRNDWVDEVLEHKVLLSNGCIYENGKKIDTY